MGDWTTPYSAWASRDSDKRSEYQRCDGTMTLLELMQHAAQVTPPDTLPQDITVAGSISLRWKRDATADELAQRAAGLERYLERRVAYELRTLRELTDKYGTDPDGWPAVDPDR